MAAYLQLHIRFESLGEPSHTVTILIDEDSPATVEHQLDTLERLIAQYKAQAFFAELASEPPRETG